MTLLYLASAAPLLGAGVIGFLGRGEAAPLSTALMALAAVGLALLALLFWATARSVLARCARPACSRCRSPPAIWRPNAAPPQW